jgi:hypothetical protein
MMHRGTGEVFDRPAGAERWFDADGSFIIRHARYRRHAEGRAEPYPNQGEFPPVLEARKNE